MCLGYLCVGEENFPHRQKVMEEIMAAVQVHIKTSCKMFECERRQICNQQLPSPNEKTFEIS